MEIKSYKIGNDFGLPKEEVLRIFEVTNSNLKVLKHRKKILGIKSTAAENKNLFSWNSLILHFGNIKNATFIELSKIKGKKRVVSSSVSSVAPLVKELNATEIQSMLGLNEEEVKRFQAIEHYNKTDIEKMIKLEDALKRLRNNLISSGKFVDVTVLQDDLTGYFTEMFSMARNLIDSWRVKYNFSETILIKMEQDYLKLYGETWEKIKGKVKDASISGKNN